MEPVQFEILGEDKSKPATDSAGKNVDVLDQKIESSRTLVRSLQDEIVQLQKKASEGSGMKSVEDIAQIEQLEKKLKELQALLIELENQKEQTSQQPIVPPTMGPQVDVVKQNINGLSMSVQQIAREMPTLAMGPQMFFLAISNNLPILQDNIRRARAELAAMTAEQRKSAVPLWKQLTSSIFSWQTALTVGITLLVMYGKDLVNWTANLFKSKEAIDSTAMSMRDLSDARLKGTQNAQSELTRLKLLHKGLTDENVARKDRLRIAKELQSKYPSYFGNLKTEEMLAGKAASAYMKLSSAILQAAKSRAIEDKITENEKKRLELRGRLATEIAKLNKIPKAGAPSIEYLSYGGGYDEDLMQLIRRKQEEKVGDIIKEREKLKKSNDSLIKEISDPSLLLGVDEKKLEPTALNDIESLSDRIADAEVKAQQRIDELTLAAMREGWEKQKAESKKQYQQQIDQINRDERERLQALEKARKQGLNVTPDQIASVGAIATLQRDLAKRAYDNSLTTLFESEMDHLAGKYEDYTNQRIALENKYSKEVEKIIALRADAQDRGDTQEVAMLDRSLMEARAKRGKDLMKLSFDQFQKSPEYIRAFEDLRNTSSETLQYLMQQMETYKGVAAEAWNPQDLREYTTTLQEITDELMNRNPYDMLVKKRKELAKAEQEVITAQMALDTVRDGGVVINGFKTVKGKGIVPTLLSEEAALRKLNEKKDEHNKISIETITLEKKVADKVYEMCLALSTVGEVIGGTQGKIISLIGEVGQFAVSSITGIQDVMREGVDQLTSMEKASVILTLISTGIKLLQKLDNLTMDSHDKYLNFDKKIEEINTLKDAVLEYEIAVLKAKQAEKSWFGEDSLRNLKDYKDQQELIYQQYLQKVKEEQAVYQNKSAGGWLTNSLNYGLLGGIDALFGTNILGNDYDKGTTAAINNLRIETRKKSKGFLGSGIGGKSQKTEDLRSWIKKQSGWENAELFDSAGMINVELAESVIEKYGNKLVGQTKETLEELIELKKQYDEFVDQLREYVSQLYSPLVDNMVDGLWDWVDEGKDAMDSFKGYAKSTFRDIVSDMLRTIVMKKVFASFEDDIAAIYEKYSGSETDMADFSANVADVVKDLAERYKTEIPYLQELLKQITESFSMAGFDLSDKDGAQQTAKSSVTSQVTEETMTWLAGGMVAQTNRLISVDNNITEFRNQLAAALSPLVAISTNTRQAADLLERIAADVLTLRKDGVNIKS